MSAYYIACVVLCATLFEHGQAVLNNIMYEENSIQLRSNMRPGCGGARLCCEGKNNTCVGRGGRVNDPDSDVCFCDSPCKQLGDCCLDYEDNCRG